MLSTSARKYCLFGAVLVLALFSAMKSSDLYPGIYDSFMQTEVINNTLSKHWIVITTIQYPTEDVKKLAKQGKWSLVVVGDTKTPSDWNLPGVHYLSVATQKRLGLSTASLLPTSSYTRKSIGYLYAIQHGAEWIYDTDDDNKPYGDGLNGFDVTDYISGLRYTSPMNETIELKDKLFNPYSYFGNEGMWPRGFPLDQVQTHINNNTMMLCGRMRTAAVQQGLVHNDPDVDAIYRLLNSNPKEGLSKSFNPYAPPIQLDANVYSPWNSQNTLFNRRAFFTMFLPTTVSFRTTDIWRSYFAQRLLHLIGENVAFYPVNAVQRRNPHSYLNDFKEEVAVYEQSGDLVRFIDEWECDKDTIEECTITLADAFALEGFWGREDAALVRKWIEDLKEIGYNFPPLKKADDLSYVEELNSTNVHFRGLNCRRAKLTFTESLTANAQATTAQRAEQKLQNWREISDWCKAGNYSTLLDGIKDKGEIALNHHNNFAIHEKMTKVLVIVNNYPWKFSTGLLQRMYEPYFASVVFCGTIFHNDNTTQDHFPKPTKNLNYIHLLEKEVHAGAGIYQCMTRAIEMRFRGVTGYVLMADDAAYGHWHPLPGTSPALAHDLADALMWWDNGGEEVLPGRNGTRLLVKNVQEKYANNTEVQDAWKRYEDNLRSVGVVGDNETAFDFMTNPDGAVLSDWFYIPTSEAYNYRDIANLLWDAKLFLEVAVAKFMRSTKFALYDDTQGVPPPGSNKTTISLWGDREKWKEIYNKNIVMLHPVKFSSFGPAANRTTLCEKLLQVHVDVTLKLHDYTKAPLHYGCPSKHIKTKFGIYEKNCICQLYLKQLYLVKFLRYNVLKKGYFARFSMFKWS